MIHLDFETRSFCNLLDEGSYNYAMHPTTQATMMAFAYDDEEPQIWIPLLGEFWDALQASLEKMGIVVHKLFPRSIIHEIYAGKKIIAHNAQFERLIFWYVICPDYDVPEIPIESFICTAAQARANNLPATLADCARALGAGEQKDVEGKRLIQILCVPHEGKFVEDLEEYINFALYCLQDVKTERNNYKIMRQLTENELEEYWANEYVNDKGLLVDLELARAAVDYTEAEQSEIIQAIKDITQNKVTKARGKNLTEWVYERLPEVCQFHMHKYKGGEM